MGLLFRTIRLALASALLAGSLVATGTAAAATGPGPELPTPALIQRAVRNGTVDGDRGNLLLAYALARPEKLPQAFRSDVPWEGTVPLLQLQEAHRGMPAGPARSEIGEILTGEAGPGSCLDSGSSLPSSTTTPHFYVEYGSIGGGLSVGSYAAALETSWATEVDTFGWAPPPVLAANPPPGNRYHVRIDALSGGLYGFVSTSGTHAGLVGNNPSTSWNDSDSYATCMVLRNNYSGFLSSPQASLDATAAHEFNHSIQFGLGALHGANKPDPAFIEGGATWMEDEVFDGSNDNYYFLWPSFSRSMGAYDSSPPAWYAYWLTFRGLTERYGTGTADGSEQVMQDFWEETSKNTGDNLNALQTPLANRGTNLADAYHAYAIAAKFNKACGGGYVYPYCLEEGPQYVAAMGAPGVHGTIGSIPGTYGGSIEDNYALNWIELPTSGGPYDVTLANTDSGGALRGSVVCDTGTALTIHVLPSVVEAGVSSSIAQVSPSGCAAVTAVITNENQTAPNPTTSDVRSYQLTTASPSTNATLSVTRLGSGSGTVSTDVAGINCGTDCSENYPDGTVVNVTAVPAAGSVFSGWSGACTGTGTCSVTVDSAKSVGANFTGSFSVSVSRAGAGVGTVASDVAGISCGGDCSETYAFGTEVVLSATPGEASSFAGWSGGGCTGTGNCRVTVNSTKSITATFGDAAPPAMPTVGGVALSKAFQTDKRFQVSWNAGEASSYDVRYRQAGFSWNFEAPVTWQAATVSTGAFFTGTSGRTYCFSARAMDASLNSSDFGAEKCTAVPVNNTALAHRGAWAKKKGTGYFLGTFSLSSTRGSSLVLSNVQATRLAILVTKCPGCGTIKVYLGNKLLRRIRLASSSVKKKQVIELATFDSVRSGKLRAVVTTSGRPVKIEGIGVSRA